MALDPCAQQLDFSLGSFQSGVLEREPMGAAEKIVGYISDDGLVVKRGASTYDSSAGLDSSGLLWVADAALVGGRRTMLGSPTHFGLRLADQSIQSMASQVYAQPQRVVVARGAAFVAPGPLMYGGAIKTSNYGPVTVTFTNGSRTAVGTGTAFLANLAAGMIAHEDTGGHDMGVVQSIESDTSLTLRWPWEGLNAVATATFYRSAALSNTDTVTALGSAGQASRIFASVGGRLLVMFENKLAFSEANDPNRFVIGNDHEFPTTGIAMGVLRDVALAFTEGGMYAVSNLAYSLTDAGTGDPQQRVELVNADLIAWGHEGIAAWGGALVVPALDNVWLVDSLGAPVPIGDRILDLYLGYVRAGYRPGVAEVFGGVYYLPILTSGNVWVDTLTCRLQPTHSGGRFGWAQLSGHAAEVSALAERQSSPPVLLGSSLKTASRVLNLTALPVPSGTADADGSVPTFTLSTVDYPTGNLTESFVHKVRVKYALSAGTLAAEVSVDGGAYVALTGTGASTATEKVWRVGKYARNVRFRFTQSAAGSVTVKSVEVFVRHSGRQ